METVTDSCVTIAIGVRLTVICHSCVLSTLHKSIDIATCNRDGKKSDSGENGVTSSYVVRYYERSITLFICKRL